MEIMEMLRWLTDEEKAMFVALEHVFESDGWRQYIAPWAESQVVAQGVRGANAGSWEQNREAYGARQAYEAFQNLPQVLFAPLEQLALERQATQQAEDEEAYE